LVEQSDELSDERYALEDAQRATQDEERKVANLQREVKLKKAAEPDPRPAPQSQPQLDKWEADLDKLIDDLADAKAVHKARRTEETQAQVTLLQKTITEHKAAMPGAVEQQDELSEWKAELDQLMQDLAQARATHAACVEEETRARRALETKRNSLFGNVIKMSDRVAKDIRDIWRMVRLGAGAERFQAALMINNEFFATSITNYCSSSSEVLASRSTKKPAQLCDAKDD